MAPAEAQASWLVSLTESEDELEDHDEAQEHAAAAAALQRPQPAASGIYYVLCIIICCLLFIICYFLVINYYYFFLIPYYLLPPQAPRVRAGPHHRQLQRLRCGRRQLAPTCRTSVRRHVVQLHRPLQRLHRIRLHRPLQRLQQPQHLHRPRGDGGWTLRALGEAIAAGVTPLPCWCRCCDWVRR